jgi:uncharacterized glyoxalase superfamily protein PhnB
MIFSLAVLSLSAQEMPMQHESSKKTASATAEASVTLKGKAITIDYSAPSARGRKIFGELVPYDKVWRTGANAATTLKTPIHLKIGTINVPAGTYTIYSLPSKSGSKLIVNKQTGQWGTEYDQLKDLGRTELTSSALSVPVETFVIEFGKPAGDATALHLKWEKTDLSVPISAK